MECKWTESYVLVFLLAFQSASDVSGHSLWLLCTYIQGETQFPEFSCTSILDDITVGNYNSKAYIPRGNTTNEDDVMNSDYIKGISAYMYNSFLRRAALLRQGSQKDSLDVYQTLIVCELLDFDKPGKMLIKDAARGSTTDEQCYFNNKFTYTVTANIKQELIKPKLDEFNLKYENIYQPFCMNTLKNYLKKREDQINRKLKPRVRLFQKAISDSGGFRVSCLATGFYPRHINLTLFRDGQPVSDHEITGGDLLPNGDGTYQMRKSLEISADKHKYTCTATHLSLDNKLHVTLEYDYGELKSVILSVLMVLALMMVFGVAAAVIAWKRQCADSIKSGYSTASASEEQVTHQTLSMS